VGEVVRGPHDVAVDFGGDTAAGPEEAGGHLAAYAGHVIACEDDLDLFGAETGSAEGIDDFMAVGGPGNQEDLEGVVEKIALEAW